MIMTHHCFLVVHTLNKKVEVTSSPKNEMDCGVHSTEVQAKCRRRQYKRRLITSGGRFGKNSFFLNMLDDLCIHSTTPSFN
jgi:hypothetical protein